MILYQKNILLGISGGIAAYKCAHLVRLLIKEGANVKVVMTNSAQEFITPKTLSVLSKNEVITDFFDNNYNWNNHVHLAEWADVFLIAPLTANTLSKFTQGLCDNILTACYLSNRSPVFVAPAMDLEMYKHSTTKENLDKLNKAGSVIIPPEHGELASGLYGEGRMAEPETIVDFIKSKLNEKLRFNNKQVLINAGPTYEAIDPVRFIGNRSSGKMGIAIAEEFCKQGANVTLVLGPSNYLPKTNNIRLIRVESADDMYEACASQFQTSDIVILSAAVADYKPKHVADKKIKKTSEELTIEFVKNRDILATFGKEKTHQCLVGFALETNNIVEYASKKLESKNLDFIIANSATEPGSGFGVSTNKICIIDKHNNLHNFELKSKDDVAKDIVDFTHTYLQTHAK